MLRLIGVAKLTMEALSQWHAAARMMENPSSDVGFVRERKGHAHSTMASSKGEGSSRSTNLRRSANLSEGRGRYGRSCLREVDGLNKWGLGSSGSFTLPQIIKIIQGDRDTLISGRESPDGLTSPTPQLSLLCLSVSLSVCLSFPPPQELERDSPKVVHGGGGGRAYSHLVVCGDVENSMRRALVSKVFRTDRLMKSSNIVV